MSIGKPAAVPNQRWQFFLNHPMFLDRVDPRDLTLIPGVGPSLARAIVERHRRCPLRDEEDLRTVPGVGPVLAHRLAAHLIFPGQQER